MLREPLVIAVARGGIKTLARIFFRTAFVAAGLANAPVALGAIDPSALLQLVDYVGVDYAGAVSDGRISSPSEYAEMQEFASRIGAATADLPETDAKPQLASLAADLRREVEAKAEPGAVAATTREIRDLVMRAYPAALTPRVPPDLAAAAARFRESCAACHGAEGRGDGPAAASLDPKPTDFHDAARERERSLYGLYNTITLGVQGTSMASFSQLPDAERWTLAFYVGGLGADEPTLAAGARAYEAGERLSLRDAVTHAPAELPEGRAALALWLRRHPERLFSGRADPIQATITGVAQSAAAYRAGDADRAEALAVSAYLDGFELAEAGLKNVDAALVEEVENAMVAYRAALGSRAPPEVVERQAAIIAALLDRAQRALEEKRLSPSLAFLSALFILLREGLEAILVLAAVTAFLVRTGRREALTYLHYGWIGALALGGVTWAAATWVVEISGAMREVTEGVTALTASAILFYVGFWMHDKTHAQRWNRFLKQQVESAIGARGSWGIAFIAFIAVYREVFETVLFYEALWAQVDAGAHASVFAGAVAAAFGLAALTWGIFRFGLRLPLKQFFAISAAVMFVLALVFAGKGISALQEAGKVPITPIAFVRIDLLGVYPTLESLGAQLALLVIGGGLIWRERRAAALSRGDSAARLGDDGIP
ncbi:MAG TPA: cytochrome c/FTR1 family iron permease [Gammaproteobacteria bacterium]|nr:cytochrome c/FTR1 family iron permease [Gammaproteobacteria bacterium]